MLAYKHTDNADIPDLLQTLDTTTSMVEAFSVMMEFTVRSGEDVKNISSGMERLLNQQCEDLRLVAQALRDRFAEVKKSKLEIRDLDTIAQWAGVSPKLAANVVSIATGVMLPEAGPEALNELAQDAHQTAIMVAMRSCAAVENIAEAVDVPPDTVRRVLDEAYMFRPRRMTGRQLNMNEAEAGHLP